MKKITIITVSLLLAGASAFAWSKKSDSLGNLGRTYVSISGAVNVSKYKSNGVTDSPTGAQGSAVINAPILKPGINAFRDIKWAGLDGNIFFNYNYSGEIGSVDSAKLSNYNVGAQLTPYLNFETGLPFQSAPFGTRLKASLGQGIIIPALHPTFGCGSDSFLSQGQPPFLTQRYKPVFCPGLREEGRLPRWRQKNEKEKTMCGDGFTF